MKRSRQLEIPLRSGETIDEFMDGRLRIIQSKKGYRFSIDAILLSQFVTMKPHDVVVDLGTGCGIIPLILLLTRPTGHAYGLEIQAELVDQARRNAALNGFNDRLDVIQGDLKCPPLKPSSVDVVICNPPFRAKNSGRINPDTQKAIARHEIMASLNDILDAARMLLRDKGRLALIYPAMRLADILVRMRGYGMEPKRLRIIYPGLTAEAKLILIEATLAGMAGLKILPPLIDQGNFSIKPPV